MQDAAIEIAQIFAVLAAGYWLLSRGIPLARLWSSRGFKTGKEFFGRHGGASGLWSDGLAVGRDWVERGVQKVIELNRAVRSFSQPDFELVLRMSNPSQKTVQRPQNTAKKPRPESPARIRQKVAAWGEQARAGFGAKLAEAQKAIAAPAKRPAKAAAKNRTAQKEQIGKTVAALREMAERGFAEIARREKPVAEAPKPASKPPPKPSRGKSGARAELDAMIGLAGIKERVKKIANLAWMERERVKRGMRPTRPTYHMVFTGNPGTGKTIVAQIIGRIFNELGVLARGHLVQTNRAGLVGQYIGETAIKVNKLVEEASGGVLFIDEAYLLTPKAAERDFGAEAIGTLIEHMENRRDRLIVIAAGYKEPMDRFMASNPGIKSRLGAVIDFPDYSEGELFEIFIKVCSDNEYVLSDNALGAAQYAIGKLVAEKDSHFGNARAVRNLFDHSVMRLSSRVRELGTAAPDEEFRIIRASDIAEEYDRLDDPGQALHHQLQEQEIEEQREERRKLLARLKEIGVDIDELDLEDDEKRTGH